MKPERIQERLDLPANAPQGLDDFLDDHPAWKLDAGGRLVRRYHLASPRVAAALARFLSEVIVDRAGDLTANFDYTIELRGDELRLALGGAPVGERDLELARAISLVD